MSQYAGIISMVAVLALMYILMIRPQRKRDKETNEMRASLTVGDEIVTIGGICGKIVKTKDDSIVIQTGADKLRIEMKRWAVSKVEKKSTRKVKDEVVDTIDEDETPKKVRPKRMKRSEDIVEEIAEASEAVEAEIVSSELDDAVEIAEKELAEAKESLEA